MKKKIFVSAYACEPYKGSEIGVGWNWVLQMSKYYELWVLTRSNNRDIIEDYFEKNKDDDRGIHFVYFDLPDWVRRFKHGMKGVYIYYPLWNHCSGKLVNSIMKENDIEIYHHLTYGNALWGVNPIVKDKFFVWGPIGGLETIGMEYLKFFSFKSRVIEILRRIRVTTLPLSFRYLLRCRNADLILCKTEDTFNHIPQKYRHKATIMTDVATKSIEPSAGTICADGKVTYLSAGRLDGWRGFDLLIEAFALAYSEDSNIAMDILGMGKEYDRLKALIKARGLEEAVHLPGNVPMDEYEDRFSKADVILNACLKEGGVTAAFDCIRYGKPMICLDTGGYTRNFEDCSVVISRGSREKVIGELACEILRVRDSAVREELSKRIISKAEECDWDHKGECIRDLYESRIISRMKE